MSIAENYLSVKAQVANACKDAGRSQDDVLLLAVSKTVGIDGVREAYEAGARNFGENRPDPLVEKRAAFPNANWHFIGNIQSRRIRDIVPCAYMIHSLCEEKHARKIDEVARELGKRQKVLIEVNVSGELSKSGLSPDEVPAYLRTCLELPNIEVCGLMTMAPIGDPYVASKTFAGLRELMQTLREQISASHAEALPAFTQLSMGMTDDWREAIVEGSTIVRIGRAIFA